MFSGSLCLGRAPRLAQDSRRAGGLGRKGVRAGWTGFESPEWAVSQMGKLSLREEGVRALYLLFTDSFLSIGYVSGTGEGRHGFVLILGRGSARYIEHLNTG